jgi:hypothetical protein
MGWLKVAAYMVRGIGLGVVTAFRAAAVARERRKAREAEQRRR